jgi:hypothetical protein
MPLYLVVLGSVVLGECSVKPFFFFFLLKGGWGWIVYRTTGNCLALIVHEDMYMYI